MGSQGKHLTPATPSLPDSFLAVAMDAIRNKMQSLKSETDSLYSIIHNFEEDAKESNRRSDQADCDIRDYGKKVHGLEIEFDETCDKLQKATESLEEKEKMYREVESDVSALSRRIMLMEEEAKKSEENLAGTVTKLATTSKEADNILKKVKAVESTCMNNEVTLEEHRGGTPACRREHEISGDLCREGCGEGGEAEGEDPLHPEEVQGRRGQVRVRRDEHHQTEPEDRQHRGRDLQGEAEDQEGR